MTPTQSFGAVICAGVVAIYLLRCLIEYLLYTDDKPELRGTISSWVYPGLLFWAAALIGLIGLVLYSVFDFVRYLL